LITFKYRLYPDKDQIQKLWLHANKMNYLYNYFLDQRIQNYKLEKEKRTKINRFSQQKELITLKKADPKLKEIHSQVLQQVPLRLEKTFDSFFAKNSGFPKFRSCKNFFGICYSQSGFAIEKDAFKTKIYGKIRFAKHREITGNIKQIYISTKDNVWFLHITTDCENPGNKLAESQVGIDIGLANLVVDNYGNKIKNATHSKYFDKQISKLQAKRDSSTKKGSRRNKFLKKTIARLHSLKVRKTRDFQHKVSKTLTQKYSVIYAENLESKKISEGSSTGLNRAIRNACFAQFLNYLSYKANKIVLVNPYNTSKTCNNCGWINNNLKLSDREITCSCCDAKYDRDENAAKNIFCLGRAIVKKQCTDLKLQEALA